MSEDAPIENLDSGSEDLGTEYESFLLTFLVFMMFYFIVAALIEKHKPQYGH